MAVPDLRHDRPPKLASQSHRADHNRRRNHGCDALGGRRAFYGSVLSPTVRARRRREELGRRFHAHCVGRRLGCHQTLGLLGASALPAAAQDHKRSGRLGLEARTVGARRGPSNLQLPSESDENRLPPLEDTNPSFARPFPTALADAQSPPSGLPPPPPGVSPTPPRRA